MHAIVQPRYGDFDQLSLRDDVEAPRPRRGEVLVEVAAASVNPADCFRVWGRPWLGRLTFGLFRPRLPGLGVDVAGTVVAVGPGVTGFALGDHVFGETRGSFAERVCCRADRLAHAPRALSLEESASLPVAGVTALQALRDRARPGAHALVLGASGGVGTFAIQVARAAGAEVTAVCSGRNAELVRGLGATHVVDYTREDFTRLQTRFDVILDLVGSAPLPRCLERLTPEGTYVASVGRTGWILQAALRSLVDRRVHLLVATCDTASLSALASLVDAGHVRPHVERRVTLDEVPAALRHAATGRSRGKTLVLPHVRRDENAAVDRASASTSASTSAASPSAA